MPRLVKIKHIRQVKNDLKETSIRTPAENRQLLDKTARNKPKHSGTTVDFFG